MKKWFVKDKIDDLTFIATCEKSDSMAKACAELKLHFNSFKRRALELGCYKINQSGKGTKKNKPKILIEDIIVNCMYPQYQTYKLKQRLIAEGYKKNECEKCKINSWQGEVLMIELDHIDGDKTNHKLSNLRMLCPNCHSQTETFRSKVRK